MLHVHEFGLKANQVNYWYLASVHTNKLRAEGGRFNEQPQSCTRTSTFMIIVNLLEMCLSNYCKKSCREGPGTWIYKH